MSGVEPNQLGQEVAPRLERLGTPIGPHVIGIHSRDPWQHGDSIHVDERSIAVRWCPSELTIREALLEAGPESPLVILTPLPDSELGLDILSRLDSGRLGRLKPWESMKRAFQARQLDPRVRKANWLADVLLRKMPPNGFAPAPGGVLQRGRVLKEVFRHVLGWADPVIDTAGVIRWSLDGGSLPAWRALPAEARADLQHWVSEESGAVAAQLLECLQEGPGSLVIGLTLETLFTEEGKEGLVRLERHTDGHSVQKVWGEAWSKAAFEVFDDLDDAKARTAIDRVDDLLADLKVEEAAWRSSVSRVGFAQRIDQLADRLQREVDRPTQGGMQKLWALCSDVLSHRLAKSDAEQFRVGRMEMAVRLVGWLRQDAVPPPATLGEFTEQIFEQDAFVDWARTRLIDGDPAPALAKAYNKVCGKAREALQGRHEAFCSMLSEHGASPADVLKVEDILPDLVIPLAKTTGRKLLFVVMDGMSLPVFHELSTDLSENHGWHPLAPRGKPPLRPALAALPSTTAASRSSLLCGTLGAKQNEENGFPRALQQLPGSPRPRLFLKRDLAKGGDAGLSSEFAEALHSDAPCIGCVVNAIDDSLTKGEQMMVPWEIRHLPMLERILAAAASSGRILVMTSDHGHLLEQNSESRDSDTDGRYRHESTADLADDELLIRGDRVLNSEHTIVSSWREDVRYGRKQAGYHGGIHPLEVLVPVGVFATSEPEGWEEHVVRPPDWWFAPDASVAYVSPVPRPVKTTEPKTTPVAVTGDLFEATASTSSLLEQLLASPIMEEQRAIHPRAATEASLKRLGELLDALQRFGGTASVSALARELKLSDVRIGRTVSFVAPLLSVDGYAALEFERASNTVRLNERRLKEQFELS